MQEPGALTSGVGRTAHGRKRILQFIVENDEFVKSWKTPLFVFSRFIGESCYINMFQLVWTPFFIGVTTFYETIKNEFRKFIDREPFGRFHVYGKGYGKNNTAT